MSKSVFSRAFLIADPCCPGYATGWRNAESHYVENVEDDYVMVKSKLMDWYLVFNDQMMRVRVKFHHGKAYIHESYNPNFGTIDQVTQDEGIQKHKEFLVSLNRMKASQQGAWDGVFQPDDHGKFNFYDLREVKSYQGVRLPAFNVWDSEENVTFPNYALIHRPNMPLGFASADTEKMMAWWKHTQAMLEADCFCRGIDIRPSEAHELARGLMETNNEEVVVRMNTRLPAFHDLGRLEVFREGDRIVGKTNIQKEDSCWRFNIAMYAPPAVSDKLTHLFRL